MYHYPVRLDQLENCTHQVNDYPKSNDHYQQFSGTPDSNTYVNSHELGFSVLMPVCKVNHRTWGCNLDVAALILLLNSSVLLNLLT